MNQAEEEEAGPGEDLLELGFVGRAFGLRGEVRLRPFNPSSETLKNVDRIFLKSESGEAEPYRIRKLKPHQGVFVAALEGIINRDEAEKLRGLKFCVRMSDLPELEEDEFYWFQLIGLEVWCGDTRVGKVAGIQETAPELDGSDILVVESEEDEEILVPAVAGVIREIDLEAGRVMLDPGSGYGPQV